MFGYDDFSEIGMYESFKNEVKGINGIKRLTKEDFIKFEEFLKENFAIEMDTTDLVNEKQLKEAFKGLDINITLFKNVDVIKSFTESWSPYQFIFLLGLSTCPYCDQQYVTPIFSETGKMRADLDHIKSKYKFPYLSMSIYNLVPVCKYCNGSIKGTKEINVSPYDDDIDKMFKFRYDIIKKCIEIVPSDAYKNNEIIKIDSDYKNDKNENDYEHSKLFKLEERYQYHTKLAEELYLKYKIYNDVYLGEIKDMLEAKDGAEKRIKDEINKDLVDVEEKEKKEFHNSNDYTIEAIKEMFLGFNLDKKYEYTDVFVKLKRDLHEQFRGGKNEVK